jgi:hypothetical protein
MRAPVLALFAAAFILPLPHAFPDRCTVDIVAARGLAPARFLREFYLQKPVIIRDVDADLWDLRTLVAAHGAVMVATGTSSDLTKYRGSGTRSVALAELARRVLAKGHAAGATTEHFAFERNPALFKSIRPSMPGRLMSALNRSTTNFMADTGQYTIDWYFSLGKRDSGVHMHHHTDGFALIHEGTKRFFFYEPWSRLPAITHRSRFPIRQWLDERVYPHLLESERPLECASKAGDLVYVPEGWWHATIVESDYALAVAAQLRKPVSAPGRMWRKIVDRYASDLSYLENSRRSTRRTKQRVIADTLANIKAMLKDWPGCAEAWQFGGTLASELNRPATWEKTMEEMRYKEKAFAMSPRNCETAHNYAIVLMKSRKLHDAVNVLSNATALCGAWQPQLWHALSKVHELKGDAAAARHTAQIAEQIRRAEAGAGGRDEL